MQSSSCWAWQMPGCLPPQLLDPEDGMQGPVAELRLRGCCLSLSTHSPSGLQCQFPPFHPRGKGGGSRFFASREVGASCCPSGCSFLSHHRHQQHPWRTQVPGHGSVSTQERGEELPGGAGLHNKAAIPAPTSAFPGGCGQALLRCWKPPGLSTGGE